MTVLKYHLNVSYYTFPRWIPIVYLRLTFIHSREGISSKWTSVDTMQDFLITKEIIIVYSTPC